MSVQLPPPHRLTHPAAAITARAAAAAAAVRAIEDAAMAGTAFMRVVIPSRHWSGNDLCRDWQTVPAGHRLNCQ